MAGFFLVRPGLSGYRRETLMMSRFRTRWFAALALIALLVGSLISINITPNTEAASTNEQAATAALDWLRTLQADNGGFAGFSGEVDPGFTADVVLAFAAANIDPLSVASPSGANPIDYLVSQAPATEGNPGAAAKLILALQTVPEASSIDPTNVNGVNLVDVILDSFNGETNFYGQGAYVHSTAILALSAAGVPVDQAAVDALLGAQIEDGSWGFTGEPIPGTGDSNTTAIAIQALVAAGADQSAIDAGVDYLLSLQTEDGSIAYDGSADPLVGDANSTAVTIQALVAAGDDPAAAPRGDITAALANFQNTSGAFFWMSASPDDNVISTVQAVPALMLAPLPIDRVEVAAQPAPEPEPDPAVEAALAPATPIEGCEYFEVTQHNMCGPFAQYWHANGGLKILGYPLTESFTLDGMQVQFFERARMEHQPGAWPENFDILLGRLGAEQIERMAGD